MSDSSRLFVLYFFAHTQEELVIVALETKLISTRFFRIYLHADLGFLLHFCDLYYSINTETRSLLFLQLERAYVKFPLIINCYCMNNLEAGNGNL